MERKIGIVSLNLHTVEPNYGSGLQTFALYSAIRQIGYCAEVIDYLPEYRSGINMKWGRIPWKNPLRLLLYIVNLPSALRKWKDFMTFFAGRMLISRKFDWLHFDTDEYALYVVGSDTIWNVQQTRGFDPAFFATFPCMRGKSIAYAPSFGDSRYSIEEARRFRKMIGGFSCLSVREPVNLDAFGELLPKVRVVLDPTMLFNAVWYEPLVKHPRGRKKYILLYQIYSDDLRMVEMVDEFAKRHGLNVIEVSKFCYHKYPCAVRAIMNLLRKMGVKRGAYLVHRNNAIPHEMHLGATIGEWLGYIMDAEFVVTNSFHGTIFSLLFQKNFFCYSRPDASSKMRSLCKMLGVEGRFLEDESILNDDAIDYVNVVNPKIEGMRKESWEYLRDAVGAGLRR